MVELEGRLVEIIFLNESNGYLIGTLECSEEEVTLVGYLPALREGEHISVKGNWKVHSVYGRQLEVQEYKPVTPSSKEGIYSYLASGVIPGIGKKMARRLVDHFELETLDVIQFHSHRLTEVSGIGESKAKTVVEAFRAQNELREIILFLSQYGVSPNYAVKIYKKYGSSTIAAIQENPYGLAEEITGIGFITADKIAKTMGIDADSKYRIYAGTKYTLSNFHIEGHTFAPRPLLIERTVQLLQTDKEKVEEAIQSLALSQKVQLERYEDEILVYSMPYYYAETGVCNKIIDITRVQMDDINIDVEEEFKTLQNKESICLTENQKNAVREALRNGLLVITGGPGTGKTTIINALIKIFEKQNKTILLGAPTGRASKRMTEATGKEAKTIHRMLELGFKEEDEGMHFQRSEESPLECDVIIIDEVSMVDILLMNSLLKAVRLGTRVILAGDADQLPSIGAGNVLKDIIESKIVKVVRLTEIFRQAKESMIIVNAHRINKGEHPLLNEKDKDFYLITENNKEKIAKTIVQLVKERLPKHYGFNSIKDIQVLTPMKKGDTGTLNLNKELQLHLNPPDGEKKEKALKDKLFRTGDKVMQIKNNYALKWVSKDINAEETGGEGVFNGDIGYIQHIDMQEQEMTVIFDEQRQAVYDFSQLDELELAYSTTIHKSQGNEFPVVIMPVTWGPPMLMTRNLLYTAITRAKKLVVLVGQKEYLDQMIANDRTVSRYSGLCGRLRKQEARGRFFCFRALP